MEGGAIREPEQIAGELELMKDVPGGGGSRVRLGMSCPLQFLFIGKG